jgi:sterol 3beta-glucosyltransferase
MKLVVATYGSEGDTRPLALLCRTLMDAGHQAHLLADAQTLDTARALGVPVTVLAGDIREILQGAAAGAGTGPNGVAQVLARVANANTEAWLRSILAVAAGCDALLVAGLAAFAGFSAAEFLRIPYAGAGFFPIMPTREFPAPLLSPIVAPGRVPRALNRLSHRLVNGLIWREFRASTNAARAAVCGLPPRRRIWENVPTLYGVSPSLLPPPRDWPAGISMAGQWTRPLPHWTPPARLAAFLEAGEPPIYIGFGSMGGLGRHDGGAVLHAMLQAVGRRRALFYPGWSGIDARALPANFHVIDNTPHDWLFPRTACVIHHGGSGTTHSTARAGVPAVIVPFAGDQPFWAWRMHCLGVAPVALDPRRMRASDLARAIAYTERADVRARACELGQRMAAERGLDEAVATLERLVAAPRAYHA